MTATFVLHSCPSCGERVTVETPSGIFSGWLRVATFAELGSARVVWRECQSEVYAFVADLVALGVCAAESLRFLTLDREDGATMPLALAADTPINRQPLLDALRPRLRRPPLPAPAAVAEGRPLGRS